MFFKFLQPNQFKPTTNKQWIFNTYEENGEGREEGGGGGGVQADDV